MAEAPSLGHALPKATAENGGLYWTLRAETGASLPSSMVLSRWGTSLGDGGGAYLTAVTDQVGGGDGGLERSKDGGGDQI